jgi:hypothetical protein
LALWFLPVVIVVGSFVAAIPWLKQQTDSFVLTLTAAVSIFVMGYALETSRRLQRRLDEVQVASQGFASSRGWVWGAMAGVVLLMLPPVADGLTDLANVLSTGSAGASDRGAVQLALSFGLILTVLVQCVAVFVAAALWQRRMSRP